VPQLEELKLSEEHAEAIIEKGIEYGAYSDEMPDTKKEKQAAADEIVSFSIDAYVNDGITSDDEDPAVAESGRQIEEILDMAGVEIEDGEPVFNDPPELEGEGEADNGGDEAPFDPDDYIEGYSELSVVSKMKAIKGLDVDNDDDANLMEDIADWENAQEKPSSRVLNYIDETLGPEEGEEPEGDEAGEAAEEEAEEAGEPWEGYDKATAAQIKQVLTDARDDEDEPLTKEQVEYVLEYEQTREKPPTRKRVVDFCEALIAEFDNGGDEPEAEEEEAPKRGRGRGRGRSRGRKAEQSEGKPASPPASTNGSIILTREQILTALDDGEVVIEL
jgi:hypothetical protein